MFEKNDQKFLQALESPEELEKLLKKLKKTRKQSSVAAISGFVLFIVFFWMSYDIAERCPGKVQTIVLLGPFAFLITPLLQTVVVHNTHSKIRTLLVFKKLCDDKSLVTP